MRRDLIGGGGTDIVIGGAGELMEPGQKPGFFWFGNARPEHIPHAALNLFQSIFSGPHRLTAPYETSMVVNWNASDFVGVVVCHIKLSHNFPKSR